MLQRNNKSGHRGVSWNARSHKWRATIKKDGKSISLGFFNDIEEAVKQRQLAEDRLFP